MNVGFAAFAFAMSPQHSIIIGQPCGKMRFSTFLRFAMLIWQNRQAKVWVFNLNFLAGQAFGS
jgi:hypothetical protein